METEWDLLPKLANFLTYCCEPNMSVFPYNALKKLKENFHLKMKLMFWLNVIK